MHRTHSHYCRSGRETGPPHGAPGTQQSKGEIHYSALYVRENVLID